MRGKIIELEAIKIFQEGRLSGKSEYTREGKREGKCEVALKMMRKGESGDKIMDYTDIGRKEINKLAKDNHLTVSWNDDEAMAN